MIHKVANYIGGALSRMGAMAVLVGVFFVAFGVTPWEFAVRVAAEPPAWLLSGWLRLALLILGVVIIGSALAYNRWSNKQRAIDDIAEDLAWAIDNILNRDRRPSAGGLGFPALKKDYDDWCTRISKKLENRAFFTRADQLHFDTLGFIEPIGPPTVELALLGQLRLKFERLRDVINWAQQRR